MTQLCWQCGALPKPATASESPETEPLHNFHHLIISNNVPLDSEIPFIRGIVSDGQSQVVTLNSQIDNLRAAITRLSQKRDKIAKNICQHRAILSPVRRVPPELVCEILVLSLLSDDQEDPTNNPPWHLGHICRLWRYYVSTYPALWSSITIPSSPSSSDHHPLISMIETQLVRSADTLLRVCWSLHPDRRTADPGSVDLILAQSSRWKSLLLDIGCKLRW
ncbi:hypothetical protein B0H14DRAFT_1213709 [Mycena olivaceomarginata]|nr:hypothetical protein B0H14DRAFT_1213709 [Mycena olivaceomarginata]